MDQGCRFFTVYVRWGHGIKYQEGAIHSYPNPNPNTTTNTALDEGRDK